MDDEGAVGGVHRVMTADTNADLFFMYIQHLSRASLYCSSRWCSFIVARWF